MFANAIKLCTINGFTNTTWGTSDCWGHGEHDVTVWTRGFASGRPWTGVDDDAAGFDNMALKGAAGLYGNGSSLTAQNGYYTNAELYDLLNAMSSDAPYVYDEFKWDHCVPSYPSTLLLENPI